MTVPVYKGDERLVLKVFYDVDQSYVEFTRIHFNKINSVVFLFFNKFCEMLLE